MSTISTTNDNTKQTIKNFIELHDKLLSCPVGKIEYLGLVLEVDWFRYHLRNPKRINSSQYNINISSSTKKLTTRDSVSYSVRTFVELKENEMYFHCSENNINIVLEVQEFIEDKFQYSLIMPKELFLCTECFIELHSTGRCKDKIRYTLYADSIETFEGLHNEHS